MSINRLIGEDVLEDQELLALKPYLHGRSRPFKNEDAEGQVDTYFSIIHSTYNLAMDKLEDDAKTQSFVEQIFLDEQGLASGFGLDIRKILIGYVVQKEGLLKEGLLKEAFEPNHLMKVLQKFFFAYRPKKVNGIYEVSFHPQEDLSHLVPVMAERVVRAQEALHKRVVTLYNTPISQLFQIHEALR